MPYHVAEMIARTLSPESAVGTALDAEKRPTNGGKNMRTLSMLVFLGATAVSVSLAAGPADSITIKGKIVNMDEAKKYVAADSFLQLVYPGKDGSLGVRSDGRGRLVYESKLAQVKMPKSGQFSISALGLEAGKYLIAGQKLEPFPGQAPTFLRRKGELRALEINVPQDTKGSTLDLGEVCFPVPNSKC
jgi:hypothetical protein